MITRLCEFDSVICLTVAELFKRKTCISPFTFPNIEFLFPFVLTSFDLDSFSFFFFFWWKYTVSLLLNRFENMAVIFVTGENLFKRKNNRSCFSIVFFFFCWKKNVSSFFFVYEFFYFFLRQFLSFSFGIYFSAFKFFVFIP